MLGQSGILVSIAGKEEAPHSPRLDLGLPGAPLASAAEPACGSAPLSDSVRWRVAGGVGLCARTCAFRRASTCSARPSTSASRCSRGVLAGPRAGGRRPTACLRKPALGPARGVHPEPLVPRRRGSARPDARPAADVVT